MKQTPWKEHTSGDRVYRFRATYGMDKIGSQEPHFSLTGELQSRPKRGGRWREEGVGTMHDRVKRHFPELADLIRWHLVFQDSGPLHYFANGMYWFDEGNIDHFLKTIVFGAVPDDQARLTACGRGGDKAQERACVEKWLRERLPRLMKEFRATLRKHDIH